MPRRFSFLHRKPRSRRDRMLIRLHAARDGASRRWARLQSNRRTRATRRRAQELFLHLGHRAEPAAVEPLVQARRVRPHVPHIRHR